MHKKGIRKRVIAIVLSFSIIASAAFVPPVDIVSAGDAEELVDMAEYLRKKWEDEEKAEEMARKLAKLAARDEAIEKALNKVSTSLFSTLLPEVGSFFFGMFMEMMFNPDSSNDEISAKIDELDQHISELEKKVDRQTKDIERYMDYKQAESSINKLNQYYNNIDENMQLYQSYMDEDLSTPEAIELHEKEISLLFTKEYESKLADTLTNIGTALSEDKGGGASIGTLYYNYFASTKPFQHEIATELSTFCEYHLAKYNEALMMYKLCTDYLNEQTGNAYEKKFKKKIISCADYMEDFTRDLYMEEVKQQSNIKFTGKDAIGNEVTYYRVISNLDHSPYIIVDKAYPMSTFYKMNQKVHIPGYAYAEQTDNYDKLISTLPTGEGTADLTGKVIEKMADATPVFYDADFMQPGTFLMNHKLALTEQEENSEYVFLLSREEKRYEHDVNKPSLGRKGNRCRDDIKSPSTFMLVNTSKSLADYKKLIKKKTNIVTEWDLFHGVITETDLEYRGQKYSRQIELEINYFCEVISYQPNAYLVYKCTYNLSGTQAGGIYEMYDENGNLISQKNSTEIASWIGCGVVSLFMICFAAGVVLREKRKKKKEK